MSRPGYLLLRRSGGLFGVASAAVLSLSRRGDCYRIEIAACGLFADEVVGVVDDLDVRPLSPLVRRYWPEPAGGWALHAGAPLVVVDPYRPPQTLRQGGPPDGE
jgi:hypothetical protein